MASSDLTFEAWWAYVVKHEIEPTIKAYCQAPVVMEPISTVGLKRLPRVVEGTAEEITDA